jgi:hypothetical protein
MKSRLILLAALVVTALGIGGGIASATPSGKLDSQVIGNVSIDSSDPTIGYVTARYICEGGPGAHVWVSVKQAASRLPEHWLTEEGSGGAAAAWSSSHRNAVVCDGTWQVGTFTVDQVEFGQGQLEPGQGWVQFCVIPADAPDESVITWSMRFAAVK